jgi:hypothetical protein
LVRGLYPNDAIMQKAWLKKNQRRMLDKGKVKKLVRSLCSFESNNPDLIEKNRIEAAYLERNAQRLRYPKFAASTCLSVPA